MTEIEFTIARVKVYSKKYKTAKGIDKETLTKTINLGANAPFEDEDIVTIINKIDYDNLINKQGNIKEIESLKEKLEDFQRKFFELDKKYQEQLQEIQELKTNNKTIQNKLNECIEDREDLHNALHEAQGELNQKDKIIVAYEHMGLLKRIRHYNPKQDLMLETSKKN